MLGTTSTTFVVGLEEMGKGVMVDRIGMCEIDLTRTDLGVVEKWRRRAFSRSSGEGSISEGAFVRSLRPVRFFWAYEGVEITWLGAEKSAKSLTA